MYNILIADDEPLHRKGLCNLIKKIRKPYNTFVAQNGKEALEILYRDNINIIFLDIIMPVVDGFEFLQNINTKMRNTKMGNAKIIILSSYANFEYAQKAIKLGVFDYMLKPIDEEKLSNIFIKIEETFKEEEMKSKRNKEIGLIDCMANQLNKLVNCEIKENKKYIIENNFNYTNKGIVVVNEVIFNRQNYLHESEIVLFKKIKSFINQEYCKISNTYSFILKENRCIIASVINNLDQNYFNNNIELIKDIKKNIEDKYNVIVSIGIGSTYKSFWDDINISYTHAMKMLSCSFFIGNGNIISDKNIIPEYFSDTNLSKIYVHQLENYILLEKIDKIKLTLIKIALELIKDDSYTGKNKFIYDFAHKIMTNIKILDSFYSKKEKNIFKMNIYNYFNMKLSFKEVITLLTNYLTVTIKQIEDEKENQNNTIIELCKEYINGHYSEDLSLSNLAEKFYFNQSYFSTLFKKKTSVNFSEYLKNIRLKEAEKLLANTNMKIYQISKKVGYNDAKYFNRIFKNEYGLSPKEFRFITCKRKGN